MLNCPKCKTPLQVVLREPRYSYPRDPLARALGAKLPLPEPPDARDHVVTRFTGLKCEKPMFFASFRDPLATYPRLCMRIEGHVGSCLPLCWYEYPDDSTGQVVMLSCARVFKHIGDHGGHDPLAFVDRDPNEHPKFLCQCPTRHSGVHDPGCPSTQ